MNHENPRSGGGDSVRGFVQKICRVLVSARSLARSRQNIGASSKDIPGTERHSVLGAPTFYRLREAPPHGQAPRFNERLSTSIPQGTHIDYARLLKKSSGAD